MMMRYDSPSVWRWRMSPRHADTEPTQNTGDGGSQINVGDQQVMRWGRKEQRREANGTHRPKSGMAGEGGGDVLVVNPKAEMINTPAF